MSEMEVVPDRAAEDGCDGLIAFERKAAAGRRDGRSVGEMRSLKIEQDLLEQCDGSSRLSCGNTMVMAAIYGPMECPIKTQLVDRATVSVSVRAPSLSANSSARWLEKFVRESIEPCIMLEQHPRSAIVVVIHVLEDDGGVLATSINAAVMALLDAAVSMRSLVSATSVAINTAGALVLDPTESEQKESTVHASFAFDSSDQSLISCKTWGLFENEESYRRAVNVGQRASQHVNAFMRIAAQKKASRPLSL